MIVDVERNLIETENFEKYHVNLDLIYKLYYNKTRKLSKEEKELLLLAVDDKLEMEKIVRGDDTMEKAKDKLVELSNDEELVGMYDKELMDKKIKNTMIRSAEITGEKKGMEKGIKKNQEQIVVNMFNKNFEINLISEITGLSCEDINKIKDAKKDHS